MPIFVRQWKIQAGLIRRGSCGRAWSAAGGALALSGRAGDRRSHFSFAAATCAILGSATPFFTAVISARIEIAISGGVRLPM